jgi:hypothetical protein
MSAYGDTMLWLALVLVVLAGGLLGALARATRGAPARPARRPSAG